jgi:hypothetical protein
MLPKQNNWVEGSVVPRVEKRYASSFSPIPLQVVSAAAPFVLLLKVLSPEEENSRTGFSAALTFETLLQV